MTRFGEQRWLVRTFAFAICKHCIIMDLEEVSEWLYNWAASWQNRHNDLCAQQRLRSAWASAHSDQSLRSALNEKLRTPYFFKQTAKTAQTRRMPRLICVLAGCKGLFVGFIMRRLNYIALLKDHKSRDAKAPQKIFVFLVRQVSPKKKQIFFLWVCFMVWLQYITKKPSCQPDLVDAQNTNYLS